MQFAANIKERYLTVGKKKDRAKIIAKLEGQLQAVRPDDEMPEAGRKVLLREFLKVLNHEAGSRTGEDVEDVHKMRVAIRQTRSAFRLLERYYKPRVIRQYVGPLRKVMRALGDVRDLDVMIHNLRTFDIPLDDAQQEAMQEVIEALDQRRIVARDRLVQVLESKKYRRFVKAYSEFLMTPTMGVRSIDRDEIVPVQVRHALPPMIYTHLANVRAYDAVLAEADAETLHALRIEFKRLRYSVALFSDVLGKEIDEFIDELKKMQDLLGRMNDIEVAHEALIDLMSDLDGDHNAVLWIYLDDIGNEKPGLQDQLPALWKRFNTKTVQRKLGAAVAGL